MGETYDVTFGATITDAGQYVDRMWIDFGEGELLGLTNDTFVVTMACTVDYGEKKGAPYVYYDAAKPFEVVKTEVDGGRATVYFNQAQAPTLTYLANEGRNYPAVLAFTVEQAGDLALKTEDGREAPIIGAYTCAASSYRDLECAEAAAFEDVKDEVNYQFHKGSNDRLIVWFHGNGEGDLPTKATNNNVAQILANRGGVAWTSDAREVFGDASVMVFQAPDMWYLAVRDGLLAVCHDEIQKVIADHGISSSEVYVASCSAGGFMTTRMIIAYPELFKAAMITCPALDAANARSGTEDACPTDDELAKLLDSKTAIWLVQGETDSFVDPELCAKRIWAVLTDGVEPTQREFGGTAGIASGFTTYETPDNKYKLTLYKTFDLREVKGISGKMRLGGTIICAEDYDMDGKLEDVRYNDHWTWVYTLRNNPEAADGTHIWEWALNA